MPILAAFYNKNSYSYGGSTRNVRDTAYHERRNSLTDKESQMNPNTRRLLNSFVLLLFNILLGSLAGILFAWLEAPGEMESRTHVAAVAARLNSTMSPEDWNELLAAFGSSSQAVQEDIAAVEAGTLWDQDRNWDNSGGMFFAFTVATSIGYGTFCPKTQWGRSLTMVYAIFAIPLMLAAFTSLCNVLLRMLANKLAGRRRDLPAKTFRILDANMTGFLDKLEVVKALKLMGLGAYSGRMATFEKKRKLTEAWERIELETKRPHAQGVRFEVNVEEFQRLLRVLVPDEDHLELLVGVATRGYIAIVSLILFFVFCLLSTVVFVYLKRDDGWTFNDSLYFTMMTFLTVGLGDLAPNPNPWTYMAAWTLFTFLGLGFTTSMVTALTDENLSLRSALRVVLPACIRKLISKHLEKGDEELFEPSIRDPTLLRPRAPNGGLKRLGHGSAKQLKSSSSSKGLGTAGATTMMTPAETESSAAEAESSSFLAKKAISSAPAPTKVAFAEDTKLDA